MINFSYFFGQLFYNNNNNNNNNNGEKTELNNLLLKSSEILKYETNFGIITGPPKR